MQRRRAFPLQTPSHVHANSRGNWRHSGKSRCKRLEIEAGAADKNRHAALIDCIIKRLFGVVAPAPNGIIFRRINMTIEPMRHARLLRFSRARGYDAQVAIHLHRVGVDDDAVEPLRERKRQGRLAAGGRPCNKHCSIGSVHRMTHVATLISNSGGLDSSLVERARSLLPSADVPCRLGRNATDIPFSAEKAVDQRALGNCLRDLANGIDVVLQPVANRRKKLFLADMDSTMIRQECIDELADYVGLKAHVAAITERAMRGDIAFEPALRERVALLKGLPVKAIDEVIDQKIRLTPGGRTLVATLRTNGVYTCLVTGGFTLFTQRIAAMIGFHENHANTLILDAGGRLTGEVAEPIFGRDAKLATLMKLTRRLGIAPEATLVAGDGANDIAMIQAAGLGVAYHAKPSVAKAAAARIDHGDLTALLYAQGYRREEFVSEGG